MTAQHKYQEQVQPFLSPGEKFQAAFSGQTGISPYWALVSSLIYAATLRRRMVVVTDQAMYLCKPAIMRTYKPRKVIGHYPLGTSVYREDDSKLWSPVNLQGLRLWTHKKEVGNIQRTTRLSKEGAAAIEANSVTTALAESV